jgi:NADPH-dependent curcumin reductase CurA
MNAPMNRQLRLRKRPSPALTRDCFEMVEEPASHPGDGQFVVRVTHISCDPTQRGWAAMDTYYPAVGIGEVMRAFAGGEVVESRHPRFKVGDKVQGLFGWQTYALSDGGGLSPVMPVPADVAMEQALGVLGLNGLTAYFGLLGIGQPRPGETVLVSGAAGATGSIVGQIARIKGCRAVGIAGGSEKCRLLTETFGYDAAIDYREGDLASQIQARCPNGVDVFFDNVGAETLDAALANLALHARVVFCGAIAAYDSLVTGRAAGNLSASYFNLLMRRARIEGFVVLDYYDRAEPALRDLAAWYRAGQLRDRVDVHEGLENAPEIYELLFSGGNVGKLLIKVT